MDTVKFEILEGNFLFCSDSVEPSVLVLMAHIKIVENEDVFGEKITMGFIPEADVLEILSKEAYSMAGMDSYISSMHKAIVISLSPSVGAMHHVVLGGYYVIGRGFLLNLHQDSCRKEEYVKKSL